MEHGYDDVTSQHHGIELRGVLSDKMRFGITF